MTSRVDLVTTYAGRYQMGAAARQDARFLGEQYQGDDEKLKKEIQRRS